MMKRMLLLKSAEEQAEMKLYSYSAALNALISYFESICQRRGIRTEFSVSLPKKLPVSDQDFCVMLGNLLENAISHVSRFERKDKRVQVNIHCADGRVLIHMQNEYEQEIMLDGETGLPRRAAGEGHGFGMQSVQAFSEKIGGNLGCYCEGGIFHIMLFAKI